MTFVSEIWNIRLFIYMGDYPASAMPSDRASTAASILPPGWLTRDTACPTKLTFADTISVWCKVLFEKLYRFKV